MDPSWLTLPADLEALRLDLLTRLVLAASLGGLIGIEREMHGKPAGFRTNLLICVGSALLTDLSVAISGMGTPRAINADPGRIAAQIVSGIGFLGAGTIMQARGSVTGLTTAATLWVVAAIGIAVGAGAYVEAIGTTVLVLLALMILGRVESILFRPVKTRDLRLNVLLDLGALDRIQALFLELPADLEAMDVTREGDAFRATFMVNASRRDSADILHQLLQEAGVREAGVREVKGP